MCIRQSEAVSNTLTMGKHFWAIFVDIQAQDHSDVKQSLQTPVNKELGKAIFERVPLPAKVWYAPQEGCNEIARDTVLHPDQLGDIRAAVCKIWDDFVSDEACSFESVRPQPDQHTFGYAFHFITFETSGATAVLLRQTLRTRVDFCACALRKWHTVRKALEKDTYSSWRRGDVVAFQGGRHGNVCIILQTVHNQQDYRGNTATLEMDFSNLMQITSYQRETIASARFAYAVEHGKTFHEVANFAMQNFVKRDELMKWIKNLPFYTDEVQIVLAVWRINPHEMVALHCDYLPLREANWAREFRSYWKVAEDYKTPKLAAVEPQPSGISHSDNKKIHVIAVENQHLSLDHVVHLFEVWESSDPGLGTGRTFLARRAARLPRDIEIRQVPSWIGFPSAEQDVQVFAVFSNREADERAIFKDRQRLRVPDASLVEIVIIRRSCLDNDKAGGPATILSIEDGSPTQERTIENVRDNTATLDEQDHDISGLLQSLPGKRMEKDVPARECLGSESTTYEQCGPLTDLTCPSQWQDADDMTLFQFHPPPRIGTHTDSEAYFWVRNTIVYQPALLLAIMETGLLVAQHWPTISVYVDDRPIEVRAFGFENSEIITTDAIRTRFRELYADHFRTGETISFGPIGLNTLQNRRVPIHEIEAAAFRQRIPLHLKPVLLRVRFPGTAGQIATRAALLPARPTKADVIDRAHVDSFCGVRFECKVHTEEGVHLGNMPVHIAGWQSIVIDINEMPEQSQTNGDTGHECDMPNHISTDSDENSLMQTPERAVMIFDYTLTYAFSSVDPFFEDTPHSQVRVETYCHLWVERDGPMRNRLPVILSQHTSAVEQVARRWAHLVPIESARLVPVRPVPNMGGGPVPHVLVLDYESEQTLAVLFDYTSDDRVFTGTGLVDCRAGFPEVNRLFDLLITGHACRIRTSCRVRANGRHYVPGQIVMLYEGIFLQLDEEDLDSDTTENATSTDYDPVASRTSTTEVSSDMSLQPAPAASEPEMPGAINHMFGGSFFDINSEGTIHIADQDLDLDVVLEWFQTIAVQRTNFIQFDRLVRDLQLGTPDFQIGGLAIVTVGNEWNEAVFLPGFEVSGTHLSIFGSIRKALFDEFPVHVALDLWLVQPNLDMQEQGGFNYRYVIADFACPPDQRAAVVLIEDPEETDIDRQVLRLRPQMTNLLLYIQIGKTVKCTSADFVCTARHNERTLPGGAYWHVFHGMKIEVHIKEVKPACREARGDRRLFTRDGLRIQDPHTTSESTYGDESAMMHLFSTSELQIVGSEAIPPSTQIQSHYGILSLHPDLDPRNDILRAYIHDRKGPISLEAFTVHVWMLQMPHPQVAHTAQRCPTLKSKSYTISIQKLWAIAFSPQPLAVTLVHPDLQPLQLRAVPIDLIVVPERDIARGLRVYLIDVIGMPLPRRLAVFTDGTSSVKDLAQLAGAGLICELPTTRCQVRSVAPDNKRSWEYEQTVDIDHGEGLTLWIEPYVSNRALTLSTCADEQALMQTSANLYETSFGRYARDSVQFGTMQLWLHQRRHEDTYQSDLRIVGWRQPRTMEGIRQIIWRDRDTYQWVISPVRPFPVIEGATQPTLIIHSKSDSQTWALLVGGDSVERKVLGTIVVEVSLAPFSTDYLFDQVLPRNKCRDRNICTAVLEGETYQFWVDMPLYDGAFVELTEIDIEPEESTTCSELTEQAEESNLTEDESVTLTQLDIRQFQFIRCHETGRPISTNLRRNGVEDLDRHRNV